MFDFNQANEDPILQYTLPNLKNAEKNIVKTQCGKNHNSE